MQRRLEEENSRTKHLVADQAVQIHILKESTRYRALRADFHRKTDGLALRRESPLPITEIDLLELIPGRGLHIRTRQESWLISLPEELQSDELLRAITSEGPTWFQSSVVFSDVPNNIIYQLKPGETAATVFMKPGSNGLAVDADGSFRDCGCAAHRRQ